LTPEWESQSLSTCFSAGFVSPPSPCIC
jgi:hypothetical protein